MDKIAIFKNERFGEVRVAGTSEEPLFCLADVAKALGYLRPADAVTQHCKGVVILPTPTSGGMQNMKYGKEGDVYRLVMRSKLPDAEDFQDWVCDEILPSIRKTGGYIATKVDDTPEEIMARALLVAKDTLAKREEKIKQLSSENERQAEQIKADAPKVLFANAVQTSQRSCLIAELAKILQQNGVKIGQNRLFAWMREHGYLCSKGQYYNQPTQKAMELGLFEIKQTSITKPDGSVIVTTTTKVTGKGQIYFVDKFLNNKIAI